jgi:hypothetical protein
MYKVIYQLRLQWQCRTLITQRSKDTHKSSTTEILLEQANKPGSVLHLFALLEIEITNSGNIFADKKHEIPFVSLTTRGPPISDKCLAS